MNLLHRDLHQVIPLYIPYPKVIELYPALTNDKKFWIEKAALEVGENWKNPQFRDFFNDQNLTPIKNYIRVIGYSGLAVIGSGEIMMTPEIMRHAVKQNNKELIQYDFDLIKKEAEYDLNQICAEFLLLGFRFNDLKKLNASPNTYNIPLKIDRDLLEFFCVIADVETIERLIAVNINLVLPYGGVRLNNYLEDYLSPNFYHNTVDRTLLLIKRIQNGDNISRNSASREAYIISDILSDNLKDFSFDYFPGSRGLLYRCIAYRDNPKTFKIVYDSIVGFQHEEGTPEEQELERKESQRRQRISYLASQLRFVYYGSNLFTYILSHYDLNNLFNYSLSGKLIGRKLDTDFAGLATIVENLKDRKSFWDKVEGLDDPRLVELKNLFP